MTKLEEAAKAYREAAKAWSDAHARVMAAQEEYGAAKRASFAADAELANRLETLQQVAAEDVSGKP